MKNGILIAAPTSGSGKTTVARGLMALLTRRGYRVGPMKCGPDYIDTMFHASVCGRPSINLDTFMMTPSHLKEVAERYAQTADVCVVEGMMGLFDGYDHQRGSAAEVARLLDLPVILVVDASHAGYSLAPLLYGFRHWADDIEIQGIIFNKVGSERHRQMLLDVCHDTGLPCLGCLPRSKDIATDSRYLGLDFTQQGGADILADLIERHITLPDLPPRPSPPSFTSLPALPSFTESPSLTPRPVIARNAEAFSFVYQETIDLLGKDLQTIDPETDHTLPADTTLLYLPGGYPEKHIPTLMARRDMMDSIRQYAERGGHIIAECGGMMYLCQSILTDDGEYPMCGILPYKVSLRSSDRHLSLGYRRWTIDGIDMRGHEFHYSQFVGTPAPPTICQVTDAHARPVPSPIIRHNGVIASYIHLSPTTLAQMVRMMTETTF